MRSLSLVLLLGACGAGNPALADRRAGGKAATYYDRTIKTGATTGP